MSTVFEIENAVQKLSRTELNACRDWFLGFNAAAWDKQFEEHVATERLDPLAAKPFATCAPDADPISPILNPQFLFRPTPELKIEH